MANLADDISGFVGGNDIEIRRTIDDIPDGRELQQAVMTVKKYWSDADPGIFQKIITVDDLPGTGQITDSGASDNVGVVRFDLTPTNTLAVVPPYPRFKYKWDIKVTTDAGKKYTSNKGTIYGEQPITLL
jgi:hypothetical protein